MKTLKRERARGTRGTREKTGGRRVRIRPLQTIPIFNVTRRGAPKLPSPRPYDKVRGSVGNYYGRNRETGMNIVQIGAEGVSVDPANVEFVNKESGKGSVPCAACGKIAADHTEDELLRSMDFADKRIDKASSYVEQDTCKLVPDPLLHTHGLATCVALSMKVGVKHFVAHLSATTDVKPMILTIRSAVKGRAKITEVQMYGGTGGSADDRMYLDDPHAFALLKAQEILRGVGINPATILVIPVCFAELVPYPRGKFKTGPEKIEARVVPPTFAGPLMSSVSSISSVLSKPLISSHTMSVSTSSVPVTTATATAAAPVLSDYKPLILTALDTMRLGEMASESDKAKARFKAIAYSKAMASLKRFDGPITAAVQVKELDGIGAKIYKKIEEILATGGLAAAEAMKEKTNVGAVQTLLNVHGIGPVKVKELMTAGIKTVEGLRTAFAADPGLLTAAQALGLKYYEAGLLRIPRPEMVEHERTLLAAVAAVPASLTGVIVGSYRRGAADSGDIDMLVSYGAATAEKDAKKAFAAFVASLVASGYIVDKLSSGPKKWMGYVRLPATATATGGAGGPATAPLVRRLDLLLTPPDEFAYSILYFTGSDKFNVAMRKYVLTLGYSLSEHGLKLADAGRARPMPATPPRTEEEIFTFFGLRFVAPTERVDGRQIVPLVALD